MNLIYMKHGRCLLISSILDLISGRIFLAKCVSKFCIVLFQVGPLRCWPGGLCLSRSIGDMDVGEFIVPIPYVKQINVKLHSVFYVNDLFPFVFSLYDMSVYLGPSFRLYILYVMHEVSNA